MALNNVYGLDNMGNILSIDNQLDTTKDQTFVYDAAYRLTSADGLYGALDYTYDRVGNRLTEKKGTLTATYDYIPGTNKLSSVTGTAFMSYSYDNAGNADAILSSTGISLTDQADYTYNYLAQRVKRSKDGVVTIYHYDQSGQLIAETNASGAMQKAYVWLNSQPLAMITADGSVYYYHNDHLGTPQKLTDSTGTVAWAADYFPFGEANVTVSAVENKLRLPGQVYDEEAGLYYNYHRYYDPKVGRYIAPDPVGLAGGINPFAYVQNNPVNLIDPDGEFAFVPVIVVILKGLGVIETTDFTVKNIMKKRFLMNLKINASFY